MCVFRELIRCGPKHERVCTLPLQFRQRLRLFRCNDQADRSGNKPRFVLWWQRLQIRRPHFNVLQNNTRFFSIFSGFAVNHIDA